VGCLIVFNIFDAFATVLFVTYLDGKELNPLLNGILAYSPSLFAVLKIGYILGVGTVLWDNRHHRNVVPLTVAITLIYFILFIYQIVVTTIAFIKH
jgi:hypothetical protein